MSLTLIYKLTPLVVCQLTSAPLNIPPATSFWCLMCTASEITLVCEASATPAVVDKISTDWVGFMVQGPLDFSLTGIMAKLSACLADAGVSLFALSTYDTDWILVKATTASAAAHAWRTAGYSVEGEI